MSWVYKIMIFGIAVLIYGTSVAQEKEYKEGRILFSAKEYKDAAKQFSKAIRKQKNPNPIRLYYYMRAICYYHTDNYKDALSDFDKIDELDEKYFQIFPTYGWKNEMTSVEYAEIYYFKGQIFEKQNDFEKALSTYNEGLEKYKGSKILIEAVTEVCFNIYNDYSKVIEVLNEAIELDREHMWAWKWRTIAYYLLKDPEGFFYSMKGAPSPYFLSQEIQDLSLRMYYTQGDISKTEGSLKQLIKLDPKKLSYNLGLLKIHEYKGEYEAALDICNTNINGVMKPMHNDTVAIFLFSKKRIYALKGEVCTDCEYALDIVSLITPYISFLNAKTNLELSFIGHNSNDFSNNIDKYQSFDLDDPKKQYSYLLVNISNKLGFSSSKKTLLPDVKLDLFDYLFLKHWYSISKTNDIVWDEVFQLIESLKS